MIIIFLVVKQKVMPTRYIIIPTAINIESGNVVVVVEDINVLVILTALTLIKTKIYFLKQVKDKSLFK